MRAFIAAQYRSRGSRRRQKLVASPAPIHEQSRPASLQPNSTGRDRGPVVKHGGEMMAGKNWQIEGRYVEYCSCNHGCPCETMADPTYGYCTGLVGFKIDKRHCED